MGKANCREARDHQDTFMVEINFFTRGVHILEKMALTYIYVKSGG